MGRPMATNLQTKGFQLTVYDLQEPPMRALEQRGAKPARSAAEVAEASDVVITMLPNSPEVEATVLGPGGIAERGRNGMLVMDMSTVAPDATDRLAKVLAGDIEPGFTIDLAYKDISLAVEAAGKAGVPMFVGAAARECYGQARRVGSFAAKDMSALLDVTALAAGIKPPRL